MEFNYFYDPERETIEQGRPQSCPIHTRPSLTKKLLYLYALIIYYKERESKVMK